MSDSDAGDDGGIDKEALREELREKYERDEREREATRRMSDLLLKGATMTNTHCGTCGDPLFQQDGTTFCPSCHGRPEAVEGSGLEPEANATDTDSTDTSAADADAVTDADSTTQPESAPDAEPSVDRSSVRADDDDRPEPATADVEPPADDPTPNPRDDRPSTGFGESNADDRDDRSAPDRSRSSRDADSGPARRRGAGRAPPAVDGDLESARDSLLGALEKFAAEAAATDDPRYARECLEAAREASETLNTLR